MNKKNPEIVIFEELLANAHLVKPVTKEAIKDASKSERILLKKILKETGQWGLLFGFMFVLVNILKKIKLIILANKFITIFTIVSLSTGSYYSIKYFISPDTDLNSNTSISNKPVKLKEKNILEKGTYLAQNNKIEFQFITSSSTDRTTLNNINSELLKDLKAINKDRIEESFNESNGKIKYIISGHVEDIEDSLHIYIKIIDKETSEVIFAINKGMHKDSMVEECRTISKELSINFHKPDPRK